MQESFEPSIDQQKKSAGEMTKSIKKGNENLEKTLTKRIGIYDQKLKKTVSIKFINSIIMKAFVVNVFANFWNWKSI